LSTPLSLHCDRDHRDLHSFPTRRSSDLGNLEVDLRMQRRLLGSQLEKAAGRIFDANRFVVVVDPDHASTCRQQREAASRAADYRSEEHTSELQSRFDLVCRLLLEKKKQK